MVYENVAGSLTTDPTTAGALLAFLAAASLIVLIVALAVYVYMAIALQTIARKTNTKNSWLAWIPIANVYLVTQIARVSGWWTLILLAFVVPVIGLLAIAVVHVWMFWRVAERRQLPGWLSILLLIPVVNLIILGVLAWAK